MASKRKFCDAWMANPDFIPWLTKVDGNDANAYCSMCKCELSAEINAIKRHKITQVHAQNEQGCSADVQTEEAGATSNDFAAAVVRAEIKLACSMAEHNISFNAANHMVELHKSIYPDSAIACAVKLKRTRCTDVVKAVGSCLGNDLGEKLRRYKFSVIINESADVSTTKSLAVIVKFYDDERKVISTNLLDLVDIYSGDGGEPSGRNLYDLLINTLQTHDIPLSNLVGIAAYGASNIMGENNSLISRLKISAPGLCVIKCICHSLHLCASEAAKTLPKHCEELLRNIYTYFAHSDGRLHEFKDFQEFCRKKPHKILYACQTHWLSFDQTIARVLEQWQPLKLYFTSRQHEERCNTVDTIVQALNDPSVYLYFNFLDFALPKFTKLNLLFQREAPTIHLLYECTTSLYRDLMQCFCQPNRMNSTNISSLDPCDESLYLPLHHIYLGAKLHTLFQSNGYRSRIEMIAYVRDRCRMFLIRGCCELRKMFNMRSELLQMCSYFDKRKMLQASCRIDFPSMTDLVHALPRMYQGALQDLDDQWRALQYEHLPDSIKNEEDIVKFYVKLAKHTDFDGKHKYELLAGLALQILALPTSNAQAERIFSKTGLLKTCIRNKLERPSLSALLSVADVVKQAGGCVAFEPSPTMIQSVGSTKTSNVGDDDESDVGDDDC